MRKHENRKVKPRRGLMWTIGLILLVAFGTGFCFVYQKLYHLWIEQCQITDLAHQVSVQSGETIKRETVLGLFGLKKGANLAQINFRQTRQDVLARFPIIRDIRIQRHLPDRVSIFVEERQPLARMNLKGARKHSGRVVDADGVVFQRQTNNLLLPTISEANPFTKPGHVLAERRHAALTLIKCCQARDLISLGVLNVDTTPKDYLLVTLGNYSHAKVAWPDMDDAQVDTTEILRTQLLRLKDAIRTGGSSIKVWTVTHPTRVMGDTKEPIL